MQNMETYAAARPEQLVEIPCAPLPLFDRADRESIGRAFEPAAVLPFQQAWLPETETGFSPSCRTWTFLTRQPDPISACGNLGTFLKCFSNQLKRKAMLNFKSPRTINDCNCVTQIGMPPKLREA